MDKLNLKWVGDMLNISYISGPKTKGMNEVSIHVSYIFGINKILIIERDTDRERKLDPRVRRGEAR